jgi:hypothetical protein
MLDKLMSALVRLQKTFDLNSNLGSLLLFASSAYIEKGLFAEAVTEHVARKNSQTCKPFQSPSKVMLWQGWANAMTRGSCLTDC